MLVPTTTGHLDHLAIQLTRQADQMSMLALNVAIEASRLDGSGRGLVTLADEIRTLADRSTRTIDEVAREIRQREQCPAVATWVDRLFRREAVHG